MEPFTFSGIATRVIFGSGTIKILPGEIARLEKRSPLMICTKSQQSQVRTICEDLNLTPAGIFSDAVMHTPTNVTQKAVSIACDCKTDVIVSIGGGSSVSLGKAISIRLDLPHICVPTTYAGSEMTSILGEIENGIKKTIKDPKIQPTTVIYDAELTLSLPPKTSATSGMNAIAHAVEALWAENKNPFTTLMALEGIKALAESLPEVVEQPSSQAARSKALYGAWLCAACLETVGMALHHRLCHTLGGSFVLPHAETHAIILPHVVAYNYKSCPGAMAKLAQVLPDSGGDAVDGLLSLQEKTGIAWGLKDFGLKEEDLFQAAELATQNAYFNIRPIDKDSIENLIWRAWAGQKPDSAI